VRSELLISAKQREQLTALDADAQKDLGQQMQTYFSQNFNPQDFQNLTPEERQAKGQEIQAKTQEITQKFNEGLDKRIEKILNGKATGGVAQMDRLHQLDLQWRGPLALMDKTVATPLAVTPDQDAKIQAIFQDYQKANMDAMQKVMADLQNQNANGDAPPNPQTFRQEMQKRMAAIRPEMDKIKKEHGDKVVALLTPEQQQKWKDMQGRKFTFRTNDTPAL
ncbi:MAG TPA: Spy/CpxP family protein refolding chaperone, partial [Chthonomonadaceae bacterium]|nr:Spy/CpxP family protein refolding chaperone [Chthonomonadaceae bacterium]